MTQYRLHIDVPLGDDEETAIKVVNLLVQRIPTSILKLHKIEQVNYRLGHDEDRQKSNYLDKNENGHVSNKKSKVTIND